MSTTRSTTSHSGSRTASDLATLAHRSATGEVMGGTQDNGTWLYNGNTKLWNQTIYGDGGTSGGGAHDGSHHRPLVLAAGFWDFGGDWDRVWFVPGQAGRHDEPH